MNKDELQKIIDQLETANVKSDAQFGIMEFGGSAHDSYIKANKEGLELFAIELLKISRDADILANKEEPARSMDWEAEWIDGASNTFIQYVELHAVKNEPPIIASYKETIKDQIMKAGCISILVLIAIAIVVGLGTIADWLF
jgi:hypothetical protein